MRSHRRSFENAKRTTHCRGFWPIGRKRQVSRICTSSKPIHTKFLGRCAPSTSFDNARALSTSLRSPSNTWRHQQSTHCRKTGVTRTSEFDQRASFCRIGAAHRSTRLEPASSESGPAPTTTGLTSVAPAKRRNRQRASRTRRQWLDLSTLIWPISKISCLRAAIRR